MRFASVARASSFLSASALFFYVAFSAAGCGRAEFSSLTNGTSGEPGAADHGPKPLSPDDLAEAEAASADAVQRSNDETFTTQVDTRPVLQREDTSNPAGAGTPSESGTSDDATAAVGNPASPNTPPASNNSPVPPAPVAPAPPAPVVTAPPQIVEFRIAAGTGRNPWNTLANAVQVTIGQTIRIINDDTAPHRLHTGGAPCRHQPNVTMPGQSFDCVVSKAVDASRGSTYDHIGGSSAKFFVTAK